MDGGLFVYYRPNYPPDNSANLPKYPGDDSAEEREMDLFLKILGGILAIAGAVIVFAAKPIVKARGLADNQKVNLETDEETLARLKMQKAIAKVKVIGGLVFLPGMIIILIMFR
jgi:hypothetical protein